MLNSNKSSKGVYDLETKLSNIILERQSQFNHIHNLETDLNEKEEFLGQKNMQINLMKDQLKVLMKEITELKQQNNENQFISLVPNNVIKTIRGGRDNRQEYANPNMSSIGGGVRFGASRANQHSMFKSDMNRSVSQNKSRKMNGIFSQKEGETMFDNAKKLKELTKTIGGGPRGVTEKNKNNIMNNQLEEYKMSRRGLDPKFISNNPEISLSNSNQNNNTNNNKRDTSQNKIGSYIKGLFG